MKKLLFFILFFISVNAFGQENKKKDSIFYLLDTAKIPAMDRMWDIHADDFYKYYTIECPCLNAKGMPTFFYSIIDKEDAGKVINKREFKNIKLTTLPVLILKSKQILDTQMISRMFFL